MNRVHFLFWRLALSFVARAALAGGDGAPSAEAVVAYVGPIPAVPANHPKPIWNVRDIELALRPPVRTPGLSAEAPPCGPFLSPDANGEILLPLPGPAIPGPRNPWVVVPPPAQRLAPVDFLFAGRAGGPAEVVYLNGRALGIGTIIAGWTVRGMAGATLVLQRGGLGVSLPRGRRVTIK